MAVTFDAVFEKGVNSGASPLAFASGSGTVSGSVGAGTNRVLIGFAAFSSNAATVGTPAMTWNGVSMTLIVGPTNDAGGTRCAALFGLIAPASGAHTLGLSWTGSHSATTYSGAISYTLADQATGWQNATSGTGTSTSASLTVTSANGNLAVVGHDNNNASSTTLSAGTSGWTDTSFDTNSAQAYLASTGASSVVTWTLGSSVSWVALGVDVISDSAPAGRTAKNIRPWPLGMALGMHIGEPGVSS